MLYLTSTGDLLRVVTSKASAVDVHATYVDLTTAGSVNPGRQNTAISSATTTTVVNSPSASTYRSVKLVQVRNRGTTDQKITILHSDGTTVCEIIESTLAPDWALTYEETRGWWVTDNFGRLMVADIYEIAPTISSTADTIIMLQDDVASSTVASQSRDITGMAVPLAVGKLIWYQFNLIYTAAATSTGARFAPNFPGAPTYGTYFSFYALTTTTRTDTLHSQVDEIPATPNATSAATGNNWARIEGVMQPAVESGAIQLRFASEVASSAITVKRGSWVRYRAVN